MFPPDQFGSLLATILGAGAAGATVTWVFWRWRLMAACATLTERLEAERRASVEVRVALEAAQDEIRDLNGELHREVERRAGLEVRAAQAATLEQALEQAHAEAGEYRAANSELHTRLEEAGKAAAAQLALLEGAQTRLSDTFRALSAESLRHNNQQFLDLARSVLERFQEGARGDLEVRQKAVADLLTPVRESLSHVDTQVRQIEKERVDAYRGLAEQVRNLLEAQVRLERETSQLSQALRAPAVRGAWGEIQLRRVVELAGMLEYCDFEEQVSLEGREGRLRPDLVVRMPGSRAVIVDAKTPLQAFLEAAAAGEPPQREARLREHASHLKSHVVALGAKSYWDQLEETPDFVLAFLPGEAFLSAALEADPGLFEFAIRQRVILVTPATLIALLKAVAYGWKQEELARNARQISELGRELYERIRTLGKHFEMLGLALDKSVSAYNSAVGSLESRVLTAARRFEDLKAASGDAIPDPVIVDRTVRRLQSPQLGLFGPEEVANRPGGTKAG